MSTATGQQVSVNLRANVTPYIAAMRAATRATGELNAAIDATTRASRRLAVATGQVTTAAIATATAAASQAGSTTAATAAIEQQIAALRLQMTQQQAANAAATQAAAAQTAAANAERARLATLQKIGTRTAAFGAIALAALGVAAVAYAKFEKQLSAVKAVSDATADEMDQLSKAAIDAGAATSFSAREAAQAEEELAKVGISVADILGGALTGSLALAAAGQLDLGRSAEIAGQAMKIFNLEGEDVGRVADALANGANKSAADVEQLAQALGQGGLVAAQTGLDLEDTVGTLAAFADNALIGSDAGTSFKSMLQRLTPQSKEAQKEMDRLGISAYDAQGDFIGIEKFAGVLQTRLAGLTTEQRNASLGIIFGSDAVRAANILYREGESGIRGYVEGVAEVGAAARVAATQMDNLSGDVEEFSGALETALIGQGAQTNQALRDLVQNLTEIVRAFNDLSPAAKAGVTQFLLVSGVVALVGGGLLKLSATALSARASLAALSATSPGLATGLKRAAGAGAALVAVMTALSVLDTIDKASVQIIGLGEATELLLSGEKNLRAFNASLNDAQQSGYDAGLGFDTFREGLESLADPSFVNRLSDVTAEITSLGNAEGRGARDTFLAQVDAIDQGLANLANSGATEAAAEQFKLFSAEAEAAGFSTEELNKLFPGYRDAVSNIAANQKIAAESTGSMASAIAGVAVPSESATEAIDALADAIQGVLDQAFGVENATSAFEASLDALTESVAENGTTTKLSTAEGRANVKALQDQTSSAAALVVEYARSGASAQDVAAKTASLRQTLYDSAIQAGFSKDAAEKYAGALDTIPGTVTSTILTPGLNEATRRVEELISQVNRLDGREIVTTITTRNVQTGQISRNQVRMQAAGGHLRIGPPRSDQTRQHRVEIPA